MNKILLASACLSATCVFSLSADPAQTEIKPSVAAIASARYHLTWADEFDGSALDAGKWICRTDSKRGSTQLPENVVVNGGLLRLELKKQEAKGKNYTGAGVISKMTFEHGYYEARLKIPASPGWHNSFWLQKYDGSGGTSPSAARQELDVIENDSDVPTRYAVNVHKWTAPHATYGTKTIKTADLSQDFHVFGCEFTPQAIKYFLDGALVQTVEANQFEHGDQNIWLTAIANTTGTADAKLPAAVEIDYVRFFTINPQ